VRSERIPILLMAMALMPYLPGDLRVEHLVLPPLAFLAAHHALRPSSRLQASTAAGVFALGVSLLALVLGSAQSELTGFASKPTGMFIRLCMPMLMLASFPFALSRVPHVLTGASKAIVGAAIAAGLCSLASAFFDIAGPLSLWVHLGDDAVWAQALSIGRFTGLFNQPLEAGIFFSVALFALLYLCKVRPKARVFNSVGLAAILLGGLLSLSKNFTLLGLALALAFAVSIRLMSMRAALFLCAAAAAGIVALILEFNPTYADSLINLFDEGGLLLALTAGRLGSADTEVAQLFAQLWGQGHWVFGRGLGSQLPLDNGYLEFFYQGGILSLGGYLMFLSALGLRATRQWRRIEGKLALFLLLFIVGASFGGPVVSANRASVALMLLLAACIVSMRRCPVIQFTTPSKGKIQWTAS
jgi:hypothetical protein